MTTAILELQEKLRAAERVYRELLEEKIKCALSAAGLAERFGSAVSDNALQNPAIIEDGFAVLLRRARKGLEETLAEARGYQGEPLAGLDELEQKAREFPLWVRECLGRWELLRKPATPLDPERIAEAQANYARGDHEDLYAVLRRIADRGSSAKE